MLLQLDFNSITPSNHFVIVSLWRNFSKVSLWKPIISFLPLVFKLPILWSLHPEIYTKVLTCWCWQGWDWGQICPHWSTKQCCWVSNIDFSKAKPSFLEFSYVCFFGLLEAITHDPTIFCLWFQSPPIWIPLMFPILKTIG